MSKVSIRDYMVGIRTIFNAAAAEYNDEDKGELRIRHYPFRKYKIKRAPEPEKRALTVGEIHKISMVSEEDLQTERVVLARDCFMLSFYLAGMNLVDMYYATPENFDDGRISYCRQKTRDRRQDNAFISIKVEPEALLLVNKYRNKTGTKLFDFANRYIDHTNFQSNINQGLKIVTKVCEINKALTTYYARFSFATIARNECGVSRDDIDLCLNHVDTSHRMADIYIKKDWSIIDKTVRKVLDLLI